MRRLRIRIRNDRSISRRDILIGGVSAASALATPVLSTARKRKSPTTRPARDEADRGEAGNRL